ATRASTRPMRRSRCSGCRQAAGDHTGPIPTSTLVLLAIDHGAGAGRRIRTDKRAVHIWSAPRRPSRLDRTTDAMDIGLVEIQYYGCCVVDLQNHVLPHSAFRGQTPDEMYFGRGGRAGGPEVTRGHRAPSTRGGQPIDVVREMPNTQRGRMTPAADRRSTGLRPFDAPA